MKKTTTTWWVRVVPEVNPWAKTLTPATRTDCEEIAKQVARHLDNVTVAVESKTVETCEHCGNVWEAAEGCNECCQKECAEADAREGAEKEG